MEEIQPYNSCSIIEHGFDAQIDSLNLCCRVSKENLTEKLVLVGNYHGEKIDWERFFSIKKEHRIMQKNGETVPQCKGCIYIENKIWDDDDYISTININNWIKCNANCIYCDRKESMHKKEYKIFPIIKDLISMNKLRPPYDITIAGGEPTITRDFDKTLDLLIKYEVSPVRVLTNAIKYNRFIEKGLKKGLVNILVSTDSGTREMYKRIKLTDKHKDVWKNIKRYAAATKDKSQVKTKYIMLPGINTLKDEIKSFMEQNATAGVAQACIDVEIGWYCTCRKSFNEYEALVKLYDYAKKIGEEIGVAVFSFDRMQLIQKSFEKMQKKTLQ